MINSPVPTESGSEPGGDRVEEIVKRGPLGAIALAGVATGIVIAMWFAFYFLVFLPRGVIQ